MQKNDNVTNKALLINDDANGFVRPHRDCSMVVDSLQFNNMSRLKTVSFSCELSTTPPPPPPPREWQYSKQLKVGH